MTDQNAHTDPTEDEGLPAFADPEHAGDDELDQPLNDDVDSAGS